MDIFGDYNCFTRILGLNILNQHMSSHQHPLHVSSCYCYSGYRFWGVPIAFQGFVEIRHIRDPTWSPNPFLNRLGNGSRSCFVGFRCFGNTSSSFHLAFICMHFPSCSFHLHPCSFHVAFISCHVPFIILSCSFHVYSFPLIFRSHYFHVHSNVHSCPFIFLSSSFHLHACSFHFACMSLFLLKFWKWLYGWPGNRVQQMVIAKVIALSLNNPSNIWHCSREIWNLPQKQQSERERESKQ